MRDTLHMASKPQESVDSLQQMKYSLNLFYVDNLMHQMLAIKDGKRTNAFEITEGLRGVYDPESHTWDIKGENPLTEAKNYLATTNDPFPVRVFRLRKLYNTLYNYR
ncbi:MAG: hypothetical protein ACOYN2_05510 [Patescibacteria group bacterium]